MNSYHNMFMFASSNMKGVVSWLDVIVPTAIACLLFWVGPRYEQTKAAFSARLSVVDAKIFSGLGTTPREQRIRLQEYIWKREFVDSGDILLIELGKKARALRIVIAITLVCLLEYFLARYLFLK
jgi:hypothetical protein